MIKQRIKSDCGVCCVAMFAGVTYEQALEALGDDFKPDKGLWSPQGGLERLGIQRGDFQAYHRTVVSPEYFLHLAWGRPSLITVPSLNLENGMHMIYFDGREILDPSNFKTYTDWRQLRPEEIVVRRIHLPAVG